MAETKLPVGNTPFDTATIEYAAALSKCQSAGSALRKYDPEDSDLRARITTQLKFDNNAIWEPEIADVLELLFPPSNVEVFGRPEIEADSLGEQQYGSSAGGWNSEANNSAFAVLELYSRVQNGHNLTPEQSVSLLNGLDGARATLEGSILTNANGNLQNTANKIQYGMIVSDYSGGNIELFNILDYRGTGGEQRDTYGIDKRFLDKMSVPQKALVKAIYNDPTLADTFGAMKAAADTLKSDCLDEAVRTKKQLDRLETAAEADVIRGLAADADLLDRLKKTKEELVDGIDDEDDQNRERLNALSQERDISKTLIRNLGIDMNYKEQCYLLAKILQLSNYKALLVDPGHATISTMNFVHNEGVKAAAEYSNKPKQLPYYKGSSNSSIVIQGDPYGFVNKLTQDGRTAEFFNLESHKLSALQPRIELLKVEKDADGIEYEIPVNFDTSPTKKTIENSFKKKGRRGFGSGIKSFSFKYEGSNPFAVKKSISAKLVIFANSFDELVRPRGRDRGRYRLIDLVLKTGKSEEASDLIGKAFKRIQDAKQYNLDFRLKAVVGWSQPGASGIFGSTAQSEKKTLIDAVDASYVTLNLTPTVHDFNIDDSGRVELSIDYLAYIDEAFDSPNYNVFATPDLNALTFHREVRRKDDLVKCGPSKTSTEAPSQTDAPVSAPKDADLQLENEKIMGLRRLIAGLSRNKRIFFTTIPRDELALFTTEGPYYEKANALLDISADFNGAATLSADLKALLRETQDTSADIDDSTQYQISQMRNLLFSNTVIDIENEHIAFFFLSDLVDVVLANIESSLAGTEQKIDQLSAAGYSKATPAEMQNEVQRIKRLERNFKKLRIVLGPLEITDPKNLINSKFLSIGDVPISIKYFLSWLSTEMMAKAVTNYPLSSFINKFMNTMLRDFLNDDSCFTKGIQQKARLFQTVITDYSDRPGTDAQLDSLTLIADKENRRVYLNSDAAYPNSVGGSSTAGAPPGYHKRLLNTAGPPKSTKGTFPQEKNYMIFHSGRTQPTERQNGIRSEDESRGIFHYLLGKDRGIIKTISLKRTSTTGHKEVRFESQGYDGLQQLREVYDVDIECYANVNAFPGTYIFVDPRGFAPSLTYDLKSEGFDFADLTDYGIGGYFMIITSEHTFGPGQATTNIQAKWVAQIEHTAAPASGQEISSAPQQGDDVTIQNLGPSKCNAKWSQRRTDANATAPGGKDGAYTEYLQGSGFTDDVSKK